MKSNPQIIEPFKSQFKKYYEYKQGEALEMGKDLKHKLEEEEDELYILRKNYALGRIKESETFYEQVKSELEREIVNLSMKMNNTEVKISNLHIFLDKSSKILSNISHMWLSTDTLNKKEIQYLLFPDGIQYDYKERNI